LAALANVWLELDDLFNTFKHCRLSTSDGFNDSRKWHSQATRKLTDMSMPCAFYSDSMRQL